MARQDILFILLVMLTFPRQSRGIIPFPFLYMLVRYIGAPSMASTVRIKKWACTLEMLWVNHLLTIDQAAHTFVRIPYWSQELFCVLDLPLDILHIMENRW